MEITLNTMEIIAYCNCCGQKKTKHNTKEIIAYCNCCGQKMTKHNTNDYTIYSCLKCDDMVETPLKEIK